MQMHLCRNVWPSSSSPSSFAPGLAAFVVCPGSDLAHVSVHGMRPEVSQSGSWQIS